MKRRNFLKDLAIALVGTSIFYNCKAGLFNISSNSNKRKIIFGVCSDVHQDLFYNSEDRLSKFIKVANESQVDFIIQLGDFCYPKEENRDFLTIWNSFKGPNFHVLGNHDHDRGSKEETLKFWEGNFKNHIIHLMRANFILLSLIPITFMKMISILPIMGTLIFQKNLH